MAYDYSKLLGRITEKFGTQARFSGAMGMSERSLSLKLNSKVPFKQPEISKACSLLRLAIPTFLLIFLPLKFNSFELMGERRFRCRSQGLRQPRKASW